MTTERIAHDADEGIEVRARTLGELFAEALEGMFGFLVEAASVDARATIEVEAEGGDEEELLYNLLSEALSVALSEAFAVARAEVEVEPDGLRARSRLWGEPIDPDRHDLGVEVKAVTLHGLAVERTEEGFFGRVFFDV